MTIRTGVQWGQTQLGKPYDSSAAKRFGPDAYDCSGFVTRVLEHAGMRSGLLPTNSADMARWLRQNEQYRLARSAARASYGSICILGGINGYGAAGHVGISLGDGRTIEAAGSHGVAYYGFDRLNWSDYFYAPGVEYASPPPPPIIIHPQAVFEDDMKLMRGDKTPHVWMVSGPFRLHLTADVYPMWLFTAASTPGSLDPLTNKEYVVPQAMIDSLKDIATL